jgi:hypothetical protein
MIGSDICPQPGILGAVASDKPRYLHNNKDMLMTMLPLVVIAFIFAGVASQCSFNPGGPQAGVAPHFDASRALGIDAETLDFPIRIPQVPTGWQPNSGEREDIPGEGTVTSVGYVTAANRFIRFSQANISADALAKHHLGSEALPQGTRDVGGRTWTVYQAPESEPLWVADLGDVRVAMTGSGTENEFTELANTILNTAPESR